MDRIIAESKEIFQTDSEIVNRQRSVDSNYVIEINPLSPNKDLCVIYFSSHGIYYPNTEDSFRRSIINKNYYEWRNNPPISAYKQIFIRDLYKQWYLLGINSQISSPFKLLEFLKEETEGYRIITIGSSAGGYAAILYGSLLKAKVYAFNSQFEVNSLLKSSNEFTNPILFRYKEDPTLHPFYDIVSIIGQSPIYYFYSTESQWDSEQKAHVGVHPNVHAIGLKSSHHGIPFPRVALKYLFNMSDKSLCSFKDKTYHPVYFSIKVAGIWNTIKGVFIQSLTLIKQRHGQNQN